MASEINLYYLHIYLLNTALPQKKISTAQMSGQNTWTDNCQNKKSNTWNKMPQITKRKCKLKALLMFHLTSIKLGSVTLFKKSTLVDFGCGKSSPITNILLLKTVNWFVLENN